MENDFKVLTDYVVHNDKEIKGFQGEYRWLSNFCYAPVTGKEMTYTSAEAAYQAAKFPPEDRYQFVDMGPAEAKKLGQKGRLYTAEQWKTVKILVMKAVVWAKFSQNDALKEKLLATGDKYIEETNPWKDTFWGVCNGVGENRLGKIIMEVRESLKKYE